GVTSGVSLCFCARLPLLDGEPRAELRPRADAQLAVDAGEIRLHRLRAHECGLRDLPVRHSARGELRDPLLARGQLVGRTAAETDAVELAFRLRSPRSRAEALEPGKRLTERVGSEPPVLRAPAEAAEHELVACGLERELRDRRRRLEEREGAVQVS